MKKLILLLPLLTGCLGNGGSSPPVQLIEAIVEPTPIATPSPSPSPTPTFQLSSLNGKTITNSSGSIGVSSTQFVDSTCGGTFTVNSIVESNGVTTVETSLNTGLPYGTGLSSCYVILTQNWVQGSPGSCTIRTPQGSPQQARRVVYTISSVNGAIAIARKAFSIEYKWICEIAFPLVTDSTDMPEELYYE
jgi:hypothetical protein